MQMEISTLLPGRDDYIFDTSEFQEVKAKIGTGGPAYSAATSPGGDSLADGPSVASASVTRAPAAHWNCVRQPLLRLYKLIPSDYESLTVLLSSVTCPHFHNKFHYAWHF